ncbi:DUF3850 domain-containing protein [Escherichia coli]|uniref:DUF3850 domain-containing protein n=1 Tax=Escherichia coli TaxID=562 RepID=UPI0020230A92|nr:DUF3850 domain-containing protein [Escherichia coli]
MSTITREPVTHNLKIWPEYFAAVRGGLKRAELRWNDREYQAGDILDLCGWDPNEESFTGDFISVTVTHVADLGQWMPGYVLLSIDPPAPVSVPDELSREEYKRRFMEEDNFDDTFRGGWNACRAAMLQGVENAETPTTMQTAPALDSSPKIAELPSGNSPVIPDGWVLVPIEPTYQMCEAMGLQWESPRFPDRYKAMLAAVKKLS